MKTGYKELDNLINFNKPQLIVFTSADYIIELFLSNALKNISVEQKLSTLYIDNFLMSDCSEAIKKEREVLVNNDEKEKVMKADELLKSFPIYLKHVTKINLSDFKEMCYEYKNNHNVNIIILNNINTIDDSNEITILNEFI